MYRRLMRITGDLAGVQQEAKQSLGSVWVEKDFFLRIIGNCRDELAVAKSFTVIAERRNKKERISSPFPSRT